MRQVARSVALLAASVMLLAGAPLAGEACGRTPHCPMMATTSAHDCCPQQPVLARAMSCCPETAATAAAPGATTSAAVPDALAMAPVAGETATEFRAPLSVFDAAAEIGAQRHDVGLFTLHSVYLI